MKRMPQIVNAMTPFPHHVDIDERVERARELLDQHGFHHLPVTAQGKVVGMLDHHDLARAGSSVRGACRPARTVSAHAPLDEVAERMADEHVDAVVVTRDDKLVGVFTSIDACRWLARLLRERFPPPQPGTEAA